MSKGTWLHNIYDESLNPSNKWFDGGLWDAAIGKHGIGTWFPDSSEDNSGLKDSADETIASMEESGRKALGPQGTLSQKLNIRQVQVGKEVEKAEASMKAQVNKSAFASSGDDITGENKILNQIASSSKNISMQYETDKNDILSNMRKELNQIVSGYASTGESYSSSEMTSFEAWLDTFDTESEIHNTWSDIVGDV